MGHESVQYGKVWGAEQLSEPYHIPGRVILHHVQNLTQHGFVPPNISVFGDGKVNHNKGQFSTDLGMAKIMLNQEKQHIKS